MRPWMLLIAVPFFFALAIPSCNSYSAGGSFHQQSRRAWAAKCLSGAGAFAAQPAVSHAISVDAAREQWKSAVSKIAELDDNFDAVAKGGGDQIRVALGTAGDNAASPLYQIDKALNKLLPEAEDPGEFGERLDDFIYRLRQADSMAYSANFAGGSGKPKPPAVYLQLSHDEVVAMRDLTKKLNAAL